MNFMENVRREKYVLDENFLPNISVEKLFSRLKGMFLEYKDEYGRIVLTYLNRQNQKTINRLYFKNNIYTFSALPKIRHKLDDIMMNVEEFKNPGKVPSPIKDKIEDLWDYYKDFVFYNHSPFDRINRLFTYKRKNVVTVDTDSYYIGALHSDMKLKLC
jgi:hypothetical protein